jgi:hypothetical protein
MTIADRWAALQFDQAVTTFGLIIENTSQEQINVGGESNPKWVAKYTMEQLLIRGFVIGGTGAGNSDDAPLPTRVDGLIYDEIGG